MAKDTELSVPQNREIIMEEPIKKRRGRPPNPNKPVKPPSTWVRKAPRPYIWLTGTDPVKHEMYHPWQVAIAQAKFRKEEWDFSFEEYYQLWLPHWDNRGRDSLNVCMTREDMDAPWTAGNVVIMTRNEHLKRMGDRRKDLRLASGIPLKSVKPPKPPKPPKPVKQPKPKKQFKVQYTKMKVDK
jgi:hypothetical protein